MDDYGPMVLDALLWIKDKVDPTLTLRRSCREEVAARSGNAVEVKVSGGCRGFVNRQFTHDSE